MADAFGANIRVGMVDNAAVERVIEVVGIGVDAGNALHQPQAFEVEHERTAD